MAWIPTAILRKRRCCATATIILWWLLLAHASCASADCGSDTQTTPNTSTSLFFLELSQDPRTLTIDQRRTLQDAMVQKYNVLNNNDNYCDPHVRQAVKFQIIKAGPSKKAASNATTSAVATSPPEEEMPASTSSTGSVSVMLSRSRQESFTTNNSTTTKGQVQLDHVVLVSARFEYLPSSDVDAHVPSLLSSPYYATAKNRSPTEYEFGVALSSSHSEKDNEIPASSNSASSSTGSVSVMIGRPRQSNVIDVSTTMIRESGVVQVEEVTCPRQRFAFMTDVYLRLPNNVTVANLATETLQGIKRSFLETYNRLTFSLCDSQHYRRILEAKVDLSNQHHNATSRRLQPNDNNATQNSTEYVRPNNNTYSTTGLPSYEVQYEYDMDSLVNEPNVLKLVVQAECRNNCSLETTLFATTNNNSYAGTDSDLPNMDANTHMHTPLFTLMAQRGRDFRRTQTTCYCSAPLLDMSFHRAPTVDEFLQAFNATSLQVVGSQGLPEIIGETPSPQTTNNNIEEIIEVKPVDCSNKVSQFSSQVVVTLEGNVGTISAQERGALELAFQDTYNDLSLWRCDLYFRKVLAVQMVPATTAGAAQGRRNLQPTTTTTAPTNTTTLLPSINMTSPQDMNSVLFQVTGECRDCPVTTKGTFELYDDAFRRRSIMQVPSLATRQFRMDMEGRQLEQTGCICPIDLDPIIPDAPTEEEFLNGFDHAVAQLNEEGTVTSVAGVSDIEACDREVREISGVYELSFSGADDIMDGLDENETLTIILDSFNSLRVDACSAQVVDVILQEDLMEASKQQSSAGNNVLKVEVVAISENSPEKGALSTTDGNDEFLNEMNTKLAELGLDATADGIAFVGPAIQCSPNRATYTVVMDIDYSSDEPFNCPEEDDDDGSFDDDAIEEDDEFEGEENDDDEEFVSLEDDFFENDDEPEGEEGGEEDDDDGGVDIEIVQDDFFDTEDDFVTDFDDDGIVDEDTDGDDDDNTEDDDEVGIDGDNPGMDEDDNGVDDNEVGETDDVTGGLDDETDDNEGTDDITEDGGGLDDGTDDDEDTDDLTDDEGDDGTDENAGTDDHTDDGGNDGTDEEEGTDDHTNDGGNDGTDDDFDDEGNDGTDDDTDDGTDEDEGTDDHTDDGGDEDEGTDDFTDDGGDDETDPQTAEPTEAPTDEPTDPQTPEPTEETTPEPQTPEPTDDPTPEPTETPTDPPTGEPTAGAPTDDDLTDDGDGTDDDEGTDDFTDDEGDDGTDEDEEDRRKLVQWHDVGECTGELVANELEDIFPYTYAILAQSLCDPLRRRIENIWCDIESVDSTTSGRLRCEIEFRCSGSCGEWMDASEIYQESPDLIAGTSCACNDDEPEGVSTRAPFLNDHILSINDEFDGITIHDIRLAEV